MNTHTDPTFVGTLHSSQGTERVWKCDLCGLNVIVPATEARQVHKVCPTDPEFMVKIGMAS